MLPIHFRVPQKVWRRGLSVAVVAGLVSAVLATGPVAAAGQTRSLGVSLSGVNNAPGLAYQVTGICDACYPDILGPGPGSWAFGPSVALTVSSVSWSQAAATNVAYDDALLRQGQTLGLDDTLTTTVGTVTFTGALDGGYGVYNDPLGGTTWALAGSITHIVKPATWTFPCAIPLGSQTRHCDSGAIGFPLGSIDVIPGPLGLSIDFSANVSVSVDVTGSGVATLRKLTVVGGSGSSNAGLSFTDPSPSLVHDSQAISCAQPAGNPVDYAFTGIAYAPGVTLGSTTAIVLKAVQHIPNPLFPPVPPIDFDITVFDATLVSVGTTRKSVPLTLTAPDASVNLGILAKNNVPPIVNAGPSPYAGTEGTPIQFDGSASSSVCGFPTLRWDFSDGGVAFGAKPFHTFTDGGSYSGLLTATDATGLTSSTTFSITVDSLAPVVTAGPDTTSAWGRLVAFNGSGTAPGSDDQATLTYSWDFGDGTPSASGGPSVLHAYTTPGTYTGTLTVTNEDGQSASASRTVNVVKRTVSVGYLGDNAGTFDTQGALSASLVDQYGSTVNGRSIAFTVNGAAAGSAGTNSSGIASTPYTPLLNAGSYPTAASFAGDSLYVGNSGSGSIAIARKASTTTYTGALSGGPNKTVTLGATLVDATGKALAGRTIVFKLGTQMTSAVTNGTGVASTTLKLAQKNATYALTATWTPSGTDANQYLGSAASATFSIGGK